MMREAVTNGDWAKDSASLPANSSAMADREEQQVCINVV